MAAKRAQTEVSPGERLDALLVAAVDTAHDVDKDLARVLLALRCAHSLGLVRDVVRRQGSMLSVANGLVGWGDNERVLFVRALTWIFRREPQEEELADVAEDVAAIAARLADLTPLPDDAAKRIVRACMKVQRRSDDERRRPIDYVRATLRGCGLPDKKAKDWTKFLLT